MISPLGRRCALVALAVLALACGDDGPTGAFRAAGVYALQTIDAQAPPVLTWQEGTSKDEVTAGRLLLNEDRSYSVRLTTRSTRGAAVTTAENEHGFGAYTVTGAALALVPDGGGAHYAGSFSADGRTVTIPDYSDSFTLVFRR